MPQAHRPKELSSAVCSVSLTPSWGRTLLRAQKIGYLRIPLIVTGGWKLKVTLPKLPRKALAMGASEKTRQPGPSSPQYKFPVQKGLYLDPNPRPGTYDPPLPYFGFNHEQTGQRAGEP